jgi:hypothetical protein
MLIPLDTSASEPTLELLFVLELVIVLFDHSSNIGAHSTSMLSNTAIR